MPTFCFPCSAQHISLTPLPQPHLQARLLVAHGVVLALQEFGLPLHLAQDGCQLLVADLLPQDVLAVRVDLVLDAAPLLLLLFLGLLQRLQAQDALLW